MLAPHCRVAHGIPVAYTLGRCGTATGVSPPYPPLRTAIFSERRDHGPTAPRWTVNPEVRMERVLVIDDEDTQRRAVATGLRIEGFVVGPAANGEEALERLSEESYD